MATSNEVKRPLILGPLEWQVLTILWQSKTCSVRDVVEQLPQERRYTTVMTTLSRLFQKGLLSRARAHRKFLYSSRVSPQELECRSAEHILSRLLSILSSSEKPEVIMGQLMEGLERHDTRLFRKVLQTRLPARRKPANRMTAS